ncbi:3'-5' exoribonuclease domain-containing protein [Kitasatospora sp. NPDC052868]|uniref:3'-5' exoribonuclease domain-containing protein n=1 Tax=Kitasatospora sp. NPDC052868 TaxID=3364060 RepID=UPI0037C612B8
MNGTDLDYDFEFIENGRTIEVISAGFATDDGSTYYAINRDLDLAQLADNPWLMANVVPTLPLTAGSDASGRFVAWDPDKADFDKVKPLAQIADEVRAFILQAPGPRRLWADYGAYDHVALCQLWGSMIDLPDGIPMWTHDLRQEIERLGLTDADLPQQASGRHNALADALHNRTVRRNLASRP